MRIQILGATAVGKTSLSVELAQHLNAEIISSDSRQCYKYMNLGTATPDEQERSGIPHHNLSIIDPAHKDSAANFHDRAMQWEQEITARKKTILYVGGSTLHQRCVIQPLDDIPDAHEQNVAQIEQDIVDKGLAYVYKKMKKVDPEYAAEMDGMNPQRITRALDVWMQTGRPFSSFHSDGPITPPDDLFVVGLKRDRQHLYDRINNRVDAMFAQGFLAEVESILDRGYTLDDPGLNTVGYKQAIRFLNDETSREQMVKDIKTKTRRYAKRQGTYFRRWDFVQWMDVGGKLTKNNVEKILRLMDTKT